MKISRPKTQSGISKRLLTKNTNEQMNNKNDKSNKKIYRVTKENNNENS